MQSSPEDAFLGFQGRMEQDLSKWEDRRSKEVQDLKAYQDTLKIVQVGPNVKVDLGCSFFMDGRLKDKKLVVKMLDNIFVQLSYEEAKKVIPDLINMARLRVDSCDKMVAYIMSSKEEVELTLQKFSV